MRVKKSHLVFVAAMISISGLSRSAEALLCFHDAKGDGTGVPTKWPAMPISYVINVSALPAEQQAGALAATQAAFGTYNQVKCTTLQFKYDGPTTSTSPVMGKISVLWVDMGAFSSAYATSSMSDPNGDIVRGAMLLNVYDNPWTVGAAPNKFDIQSAVTQLIAHLIGFYAGVGNPFTGPGLDIQFNQVNTTLAARCADGVQGLEHDRWFRD
jgi:hypothetical protein